MMFGVDPAELDRLKPGRMYQVDRPGAVPLWSPPATAPEPSGTTWTIVFTNVDGRSPVAHWLLGWFRPGFRHVFALRDLPPERGLPFGAVQLVQLTTKRLQIETFPAQTVASRLRYTEEIECLRPIAWRTVTVEGDEAAWVPRGMNCVSVMRSLVGMPSKVQTPWGLYRELGGPSSSWRSWLWRWCGGWWIAERQKETNSI